MGYLLFEFLIIVMVVNVLYTLKPIEILTVVKVVNAKITTVILLDNAKQENAVIISTQNGSRDLNNIGEYVDMLDNKKVPPTSKIMPAEEITKRFATALAVSPKEAISYSLYFEPNIMKLTEESEDMLLIAIKMMESRKPCIVDIIGHTDTVGSSQNNMKFSLRRAVYVKELIDKNGVKVELLNVKGFGEEDLFVATADNVAEAKNRNVEIYIK